MNPVNSDEDFTDSWEEHPEYYEAFKMFSNHLYNEWQKLKIGIGVPEEGIIMKGLFGDDLFGKAQVNQTARIEERRKSNELAVTRSTGVLAASGKAGASTIKPNTFFGA